MDNDRINIEKLDGGSNWLTWKFLMRQVLESNELFDYVDGTILAPTNEDAAAIVAWKKNDAKARRAISTACKRQPLLQIMNCNTAKDMWTILKSTYEQASKSNILFLQQRYYSFAKEPGDDIATCLSKLVEIVQQLKDQNENISDSMVMTKILMSLPAEYNHFHSAWESTNAENQTMANLRARLMAEELRIKSQGNAENVEALVAKKNFPNTNTLKKEVFSSQQYKRNNNTSKPKGKCFLCGKIGHWKRDCKKNNSDSFKKEDCTDAFVCHGSTTGRDRNSWVLDSGASDHMCHRQEWFENLEKVSLKITIGNGEQIMARGKGDINILAYDGNQWIRKRMVNVLFVPDIHLNLFSSGKAMDNGYQLRSDNKRCELLKNGNIVAVGVRRDRLFEMMFKIEETETNETNANVAFKKTSLKVWHEIFGHQNIAHVKKYLQDNKIDFLNEEFECEACIYGKLHRGSYKMSETKTKICGEIIHADLCGPMQTSSIGGSKYFLLVKDRHSHFRFVYFLKQKSEVAAKIKIAIAQIQQFTRHKVVSFRSDNGTEFVNGVLRKFFDDMGIEHQRTVAYTHEQNGCVERDFRTIVEAARTIIHAKQMDYKFWAEAVNFIVHVLNRTGTSSVLAKTPYELWFNKKANIEHLQIFGSEVYVHIPKEKRHKLDAKAIKCIFIGYESNSRMYRVWNSESNKVEVACDVFFRLEKSMVMLDMCNTERKEESNEVMQDTEVIFVDPTEHDAVRCYDNSNVESTSSSTSRSAMEQGSICELDNRNVIERRLRDRSNIEATPSLTSKSQVAMLSIGEEPNNFEQAINSEDHRQWEQAMDEEYNSLIQNRTWILVQPPNNQKVIDNRWVYKIKSNLDGSVDRYKARLVVRGFTQEYGVDYQETFSPVVKYTSIRAILALAASKQMDIQQFDVKTAFLNGDLEEDVFMKQPIGYDDGSGKVCKLLKSLYGLKQASRCWNKKFTSFIQKFNFVASKSDPCVFVRNNSRGMMILAIYVDDGLIIAKDKDAILPVIEYLNTEFEIKQLVLKSFLGLEIDQRSDGSIHVGQCAYANKILNRFGMADSCAVATPLDNTQNLGDYKPNVEIKFPYREAIGSLMYLAVATRPDISFAVGNVSRYMENPAVAHVNAVKRILKYIKGTLDMGIVYKSGVDMILLGYSDADYAGDVETRRSTSGFVFMFGNGIISWGSERQRAVALSTTESEYIAAAHAVKEMVWLYRLLSEIFIIDLDKPTFLMDNQSAIRLIKNPEFHKRTKHIDVRYHFIRDKYEEGIFNLEYVNTDEQLADVLTKALPKTKHQYFCKLLSLDSKKKINVTCN